MGVVERFAPPDLFDVDHYLSFLENRSDKEKWQLVDGVAQRIMTPPSIAHQTIALNLAFLLRTALRAARVDLTALCEIGVRLPARQDFQPEPDVVVLPRGTPDGRWTERFMLVAEVLSPSNDREMIDRKVDLYSSAADNLHILVVAQDVVKVVHRARSDAWKPIELGDEDRLVMPEFGFDVPVVDLYQDTHLDPR